MKKWEGEGNGAQATDGTQPKRLPLSTVDFIVFKDNLLLILHTAG